MIYIYDSSRNPWDSGILVGSSIYRNQQPIFFMSLVFFIWKTKKHDNKQQQPRAILWMLGKSTKPRVVILLFRYMYVKPRE